MTADKAKDMLLEEHRRTIDHEKDNTMALAGRFGKQSRPDRAMERCSIYQKPGHTKDTCWKEYEEQAPNWFKEREALKSQNDREGAMKYNGAF